MYGKKCATCESSNLKKRYIFLKKNLYSRIIRGKPQCPQFERRMARIFQGLTTAASSTSEDAEYTVRSRSSSNSST